MKIAGLNEEDLCNIDLVFCYFMAEQASQIKNYALQGSIEECTNMLDELNKTIATYDKVKKAIDKYEK